MTLLLRFSINKKLGSVFVMDCIVSPSTAELQESTEIVGFYNH